MWKDTRKLPAILDVDTGVMTAFPRSRRPTSMQMPKSLDTFFPSEPSGQPTSMPPSMQPTAQPTSQPDVLPMPPIQSLPPAAYPTPSRPPAPEQRPSFRELTESQLAALPSAEPTLSSGPADPSLNVFFDKPLVPMDKQKDAIVQKVESVNLVDDIRPSDGSAVSLAAVGPEDRWLTINPTYSPFRKTYKRHTPFAISQVEQVFERDFQFGKTNIAVVPLSGDAVSGGFLEVTLPALDATGTWVPYVGLALVKTWRLLIGDQLVQSVPRDWTYYQTVGRTPISKFAGLSEMLGATSLDVSVGHVLYIPIPFFFTSGDGSTPKLVLPVSSLSNASTVKPTRMELIAEDIANLVNLTDSSSVQLPTSVTSTIVFDYVYMCDQERAAFVAFGHRMLYSAVAEVEERAYRLQGDGTLTPRQFTPVQLNGVNKNVTNMIIVASEEDAAQRKTLFEFRGIGSIDLFLNGQQKRFQTRPGDYFSRVVPYMHGGVSESDDKRANVYQYSFTVPGTFRSRDNAGHVNLAAFGNPTVRVSDIEVADASVPMKVTVMCEYLNFLTTENGFARVETL